mgnify:CR=1 FL=1
MPRTNEPIIPHFVKEINNINPGSEKKFLLSYKLVETRYVTVNGRTVEQAYKRANKEVERRIEQGLVHGFRHDNEFKIRGLTFLTGVKNFFKSKLDSWDSNTGNLYVGYLLTPELLDKDSEAA